MDTNHAFPGAWMVVSSPFPSWISECQSALPPAEVWVLPPKLCPCPAEAPSPSSQLLLMLPLPSPVKTESYPRDSYLIGFEGGLGIRILKISPSKSNGQPRSRITTKTVTGSTLPLASHQHFQTDDGILRHYRDSYEPCQLAYSCSAYYYATMIARYL